MTRPKLRPCPTCQTLNKASIKTCTVCYGTLSTKKKLIEKAATLDGQWGQGVVRNRNVNRIIDSARIAVLKLEALVLKPILFYGHRDKKSQNKWVADVMTHFAPSSLTKHILDKMQRAYEILLTKEQSQTLTEEQPAEQPQSSGALQSEPTSGAEQPQPEFIVLNLVTCPTSPSSSLPTNTTCHHHRHLHLLKRRGHKKRKKIV
ncbi:hypothetical protein F7725_009440, partial [Dissostichus mawsoni]